MILTHALAEDVSANTSEDSRGSGHHRGKEPAHAHASRAVLKFIVLSLPWRKGKTPTAEQFKARGSYDFEQERIRTLRLIEEFTAKPIDATWSTTSFLGQLTGKEWSRLQGKHVDYHLTQFGV